VHADSKLPWLLQVGRSLGAAKDAIVTAPPIYGVGAALAASGVAYAYYQYQYGGYQGDLSPEALRSALAEENNVFVVDVRPEEVLASDGVLDLRRDERRKATSVPTQQVRPGHSSGNILRSSWQPTSMHVCACTFSRAVEAALGTSCKAAPCHPRRQLPEGPLP
jgi:hypothetical protein